jgi:uncharacterized protein YciI
MWFLAVTRNRQPPAERTVSLDEHLAWVRAHHDDGAFVLSGPSADRTQAFYVVRAASADAARSLMASDPFDTGGATSAELTEWDVQQVLGVGAFSTAAQRVMAER